MTRLTPHDYQEEALELMLAEPTRACLLASDMGRGKTLMAVEFALRIKAELVLVVGVKDTWGQFNERFLAQSGGTVGVKNINSTASGKRAEADLLWGIPGVYFIGAQLLTRKDWANEKKIRDGKEVSVGRRLKTFDNLELDLVIADEVHLYGAPTSRGRKTLMGLNPKYRVAMSGTFYGNKFQNAWAPTAWLWPDIVDQNFYSWKARWCLEEAVLTRRGTELKKTLKSGEQVVIKELKGEIPPEGRYVASLPLYIRHEDDMELPEPRIVEVDLLPEQRRMYSELEDNLLTWIKGHPFAVEFPSTLAGRLRTASLGSFSLDPETDEITFDEDMVSSKLDALLAEIERAGGERQVIGTHSKRYAREVARRMQGAGLRAVVWTGDTSTKKRSDIKQMWLDGDIDFIVTVMKSFSTGLDWAKDGCNRMTVLSRPVGDGVTFDQWIKRVFRPGGDREKFEWTEIIARDTYDTGDFASAELAAAVRRRSMGA